MCEQHRSLPWRRTPHRGPSEGIGPLLDLCGAVCLSSEPPASSVLLSFQVVPIGLWSCTTDLAVVHGGLPGARLGLSRNGSASLVKLRSQGPSPPEPSRMPAASVGPAGTLVGDPSGGSLSLPSKERLHLAALVCPHSFWSPLTLSSWKVDAAVGTASCCCCCCCWCTPLATWG